MIRPRSGPLAIVVGVSLAVVVTAACAKPNLPPEDEVIDVPDRSEPLTTGDAAKLDASRADTFVPEDAGGDARGDGGATGPRVFVSSTTMTAGAINGLAGGDALCKSLATAAGITGTWAAWLSVHDNGPHAIDRVTGAGPWRLVSGELVATSKTTLASGTLLHAIDHDEKGVAVAPGRVWTGTGADGTYSTNDCERWSPAGGKGRVGATDAVDATWTTVNVDDCPNLRRIYCFQL